MKVTVTGGAGFIGANLVRALIAAGREVSVIDDFSTGYESNLDGLDVNLYRGSILDADLLAEACDGADCIVHLAALGSVPRSVLDPELTHSVNVSGTMSVLQAARANSAQVIFASSSSVYGSNPVLPKHEDLACAPLSPYAASKLAAESYVLAYQHSYGLPCVAFRFFNVYGPLQAAGHTYAAVIPQFVSALVQGTPITVYGDGQQTRDFTSVDSVVSVIVEAVAEKFAYPEPINLAFGTCTSILELLRKLEELSGRTTTVIHEPSRAGDVRESQADGARLHALFPSVRPQPLEDGLRKTIDWFRSAQPA